MFKGEVYVKNHAFSIDVPGKKEASGYYSVIAQTVSSWTQGEHMLPKSSADILSLFAKGHSVLVFDEKHLVGHGAFTAVYSGKKVEIGAIVTSPEYRHKGVGTAVTWALLAIAKEKGFADWTVFALANPQSAKLFEKLGAKSLQTKELGKEPWVYCVSCPKYIKPTEGEPFFCCDTPYNLTPLVKEAQAHVSLVQKDSKPLPGSISWRGHEAGWGLKE